MAVATHQTPRRSPTCPAGHRQLPVPLLLRTPEAAGLRRQDQEPHRQGLTDLVFALTEPYPEAVGIYIEHGWGKPTSSSPGTRCFKIEDDAIFVQPPEDGDAYPPFVDQPGWILLDKHLMGRTILDMDGRRTEVVNDVHLLEAKGRLLIVHVDISFNGFLRRWGLRKARWIKDELISWKYVQPLSVEDAVATDKVVPLGHPQADRGTAQRGPRRRPRGALGRGAGGALLRPRLGEGRRDPGGGRAAGPAPAHRQPAQGAGPERSSRR